MCSGVRMLLFLSGLSSVTHVPITILGEKMSEDNNIPPRPLGPNPDRFSEEQYREMMWKYTKEYFQSNPTTPPIDKSVGVYKQKGTINKNLSRIMEKINLPISEIDFQDVSNLKLSSDLIVVLKSEMNLFVNKMSSPEFDPLRVIEEHLNLILNGALTRIRNSETDTVALTQYKTKSAAYLLNSLGRNGFITITHGFKPKQFLKSHRKNPLPVGANIIALLPGSKFGTKQDKILVVGAHWDSVMASPGFNDNASGVAAVLETARAFAMGDCKTEYSVMFVLFDLEEYGSQGSMLFVQDILIPNVLQKLDFPGFQGAYILDSIMNFNATKGSQYLPNDYKTQLPIQSREIEENGSKGDFIGVYSKQFDDDMSKRFKYHWDNQDTYHYGTDSLFKLKEFQMEHLDASNPDKQDMVDYANFLRSDHVRFWYSNHHDFYASLKAVLVSDTGPARGIMKECYHATCDSSEMNRTKVPFANLKFLSKIVQTTIDTVLDASGAECANSKRKITPFPKSPNGDYYFKFKHFHHGHSNFSVSLEDIVDNSIGDDNNIFNNPFENYDGNDETNTIKDELEEHIEEKTTEVIDNNDPEANLKMIAKRPKILQSAKKKTFQYTNAHFLVQDPIPEKMHFQKHAIHKEDPIISRSPLYIVPSRYKQYVHVPYQFQNRLFYSPYGFIPNGFHFKPIYYPLVKPQFYYHRSPYIDT